MAPSAANPGRDVRRQLVPGLKVSVVGSGGRCDRLGCMPIWLTKQMRIIAWGATQFRVMSAQHQSGSLLQLAMLRRRGELGCPDDIFILLPDESLKDRFPGFEEVSQNDVPAGLRLLVGTELDVVARFPDVAAKLLPVDEPEVLSETQKARGGAH